ncbi:MAG TPA: TonB-dependent receptor [Tenuifilaceae bacterium]|nr:TonB-dependent receptor [Tenuifilaceae bacterium]
MLKSFKTLALSILFLGLANLALAQGVLKGVIVDEQSGEPLIGATVMVEKTAKGTATSLDGSFSLPLENGKYNIQISYVGYLEKIVPVEVSGETSMGKVALKSDAIGLEEVLVVSSIARDRQTPVAVATIKAEVIQEKLGTQEFPEILKSTPSVYATKQGGGYGDSRINLRGFDSNNIGVLINGVPVNDMESGRVYWSNWAGLADVTRTMQVQRGLGASRLALSSVGGTINIVTNSTDAKMGGNVSYVVGNDGYSKKSFMVSTGLTEKNWAITLSGAQTQGDGYVKGTNFEGWSYFANISKRISDKHTLSLTAFGAPQWHNQRYNRSSIQTYRDHQDGIKYNADYGYHNGKVYATAYNYYHKPQISLNHFWTINSTTNLSTSAYASLATGGGRRAYGPQSALASTARTPEGLIDWNAIIANNAQSATGSQTVMANSVNSHDWYGVLSTFNKDYNNIKITAGADVRYYKGYHMYILDDLLGGDYFLDVKSNGTSYDVNRDPSTTLKKGDTVNYYYYGEVLWGGLFTQAEYTTDKYSAFVSAAVSQVGNKRTDFFTYLKDSPERETDWQKFTTFSIKGGANYNITENHNVFVNGGYFTRAPFFRSVFLNYRNEINEAVKLERVFSAEVGYGYRSRIFSANVTAYRTAWLDKALSRTVGLETYNILGLDAIHQGIEVDFTTKPIERLEVRGMLSLGDWRWGSDVNASVFDENNQPVGSPVTVFSDGLHVGDAAQTTASIGVDYEFLPKFKVALDWTYYDRLYAYFDVNSRQSVADKGIDAWKMPSYQLVDLGLKYDFKVGGMNTTLYGNIYNLFDVEYISDANDGSSHDFDTATVYYGFGRTWNMSIKVKF